MRSEDDFRKFIEARHWRYAKTMPQWSHEYTVRRFQDAEEEQALFEEAVAFIRAQDLRANGQELDLLRH